MRSILLLLLFTVSFQAKSTQVNDSKRGPITEYDAGAPKNSNWINLFAETPNYRAFGAKIISGKGEKFRWKMGPMFYRGRLDSEKVKVFIIGQEGAQDENLSNRSFTGSTGTRIQKFLNYLGINKSYLFMNTFVYTITGQYSLYGDDALNEYKKKQWKQLMWMAQNEDSIIVQHRHKMFNYMHETNKKSLALVIGVGRAGKESLVTWFNSVSEGSCNYSKLTSRYCEGKGKLEGVIGIGVRHPGAASARNAGGSATGSLVKDFKKKANFIAGQINKNQSWLPKDSNAKRDFSKEFKYGHAPIPHRDFAFGTPWILGKKGTSSNRRGSHTIQIFSANGCYNNGKKNNGRCRSIPPGEQPSQDTPDERVHYLTYKNPRNTLYKNQRPLGFLDSDLPFEPPKSELLRHKYDVGPNELSLEMMNFFSAVMQSPHKDEMYQDHSFGPTGIYRGNTVNPELLILADQKSHTDMFSGRALTGAKGQELQGFLTGAGLQNRYIIVRTMPVDCLNDGTKEIDCNNLKNDNKVVETRNNLINKIVNKFGIKSILTYGEFAKSVINNLNLDLPVFHINPNSNNVTDDFTNLFHQMKNNVFEKLNSEYKKSKFVSIPRSDLPYSSRWWMGTSGDRASRSLNIEEVTVYRGRVNSYKLGQPNGNYYKVYAPNWSNSWKHDAKALSSAEKESIRKFKETGL